ncbi:MAG TPA: hypothetical protein PLI43_00570 [Albidovulum sp.]|uniref:hypothetical protein n=1 Tax=Albidovulum sp. TaxID=1872424 RepID=UPI002CC10386|nr:hypothetical protein [Albidovulum sp.]
MDIALHLGVHCTDDERLLRALLKNRSRLTEDGIALPASRTYRQMLPKLVRSLRGSPAGGDVQEMVRDALLGETRAERLILSHENLACFPGNAAGPNGLYPYLHQRVASYANIFPGDDCTFFLALKNPAVLVPEVLSRAVVSDREAHLGGIDPLDLSWGPVIKRMLEAVPDARLVLWCNEDTPIIWPELLHAVAGLDGTASLEGEDDILTMLLSEEGLGALRTHLAEAEGPFTQAERHDITASFLERYARPEEMEAAIDMPGWSAALVAEMAEIYDEDVAEAADLPGVSFLLP